LIAPLHFVVLTPTEVLLDATPVQWIRLRLADGGLLSIHPGHAPLLAETVEGAVHWATADETHKLELQAGVLWITPEKVVVLVPGALGREQAESVSVDQERELRFERLARTLLDLRQGTSVDE